MLRVTMAVLIFIGPMSAYCQGDAAPQQESAQPAPAQDKEARLKQLVDLLKTFSDQDYQSALKQSGADVSGHPELVSRSAALKTGYTTLAALEYHQATQEAPKDSAAKYSKAYKHVVEKDAALVAINPDTMQETGRWMDILKGAALVALKYGITAAIMAAGQEIPSPAQAQREGAIDRYQGQLAGADLTPDQKAQLHYQLGSQYEQTAAAIGGGDGGAQSVQMMPLDQFAQPNQSMQSAPLAATGPMDPTQTHLLQIVNFLSAISDKDYQGAMGQAVQLIPTKGQRPPLLVSRAAALQTTYDSMAALEYQKAAQKVPGDAGAKYSQAYQHAVSQDAAAAAIDGQNLEQTGWALDVFKFLGNAAINYELGGGQVYVGRQVRSPEARKLDKQIDDLQAQLSAKNLSPEKEAELDYKVGAAYEARAAASASPETADDQTAKKEARVKQLAGLLTSVSDDDYEQAAQMAGVDKKDGPDMASRSAALKTAYTTMAGFEYHQASKQAPKQESYSSDYKRVAGEDAQNLGINPDTLQETGWFTDLLGLAALGGAGYAIYNATQKDHHSSNNNPGALGSNPIPPPPPPANAVFSPSVVVSGGASSNSTSSIGRSMARDSAGNLYFAYLKSYGGAERIFVARSANNGASWSDTTSVPVDNSGCPQVGNPVLAIDASDTLWLGAISNVPPGLTLGTRPGDCTYERMGVISAPAPGSQWSAWQFIKGAYPYIGFETARAIAVAGDNSVHMVWSGQDATAPPGYSYGYVVRHASYSPATGTWSAYSLVPGGDGSKNIGLNSPDLAIDGNNTLHVVSRQYGPSMNAPAKLVHSSLPAGGAGTAWTTSNTMYDTRYNFEATLLSNGQVLVTGGYGGSASSALTDAELFNPATGSWTKTGAMNTARYNHAATLLPNGKVLVAGGFGPGAAFLSSAELYDPSAGTWMTISPMKSARAQQTATPLPNGQVLVAGGSTSGAVGAISAAELFNPADGSWTATAPMNSVRYSHMANLLNNGQVLVTGGCPGGSSFTASAELYNPASGTWTLTGSMSTARYDFASTMLSNGKVLATGGINVSNGPSLTSAEVYDPATGTWAMTGPMNSPRSYHAATLLANGQVLATGGFIGYAGYSGPILSAAELYNPATNSWTATLPMNTARGVHTSTVLSNGQVLVAGGMGNGALLSSSELYGPSAGTWTSPETVVDLSANGLDQENPSLAVDSSNNLQLVWDGQDANNQSYQVKYSVKNAGGSWSAWTNVLPQPNIAQRNPSLAIDALGGLNAVWTDQAKATGCVANPVTHIACNAMAVNPPPTLQIARGSAGAWTGLADPTGAAAPQAASTTARWSAYRDNGGDLGIGWTQIDGTVRYAQAPAVAMAAGFPGSAPLKKPAAPLALVATGRGVNSSQSAEALDERLASDGFNPAEGASVHHQLGKVYEQLAMAAAPEAIVPPKVQAPALEPAKKPKAKPAPIVEKPAEQPKEPSVETTEAPQPTEEDQRRQGERDLEDTGKSMDQDAQQRLQQMQQH